MENLDYISIISVAFLGSLGHCIGMCGGLVVAYTSTKVEGARVGAIFSHLFYNLGRISSYAILGAIFGFLGSIISFSNQSKGILFLVIAIVMLLMGLSLAGKIRFLNSIEIDSNSFLKSTFSKLLKSKSLISFYLLGGLNGLLPCGFVYFFLASAVASGSAFDGAIVMILFGLATTPIMFSLGFFVGFLKSTKFRSLMIKLASLVIILYALFTGYKAIMLLTNPEMGMMNHSNHMHMHHN
jgi:hypothetical protein